ncbi:MAG: Heterodimeric efflux ABC transporter, permease/ATP-binding subunit 1 [Candidatus Bipolaricaulis sibiricus]|uniref:Heterodimeric efflux ABC transporter, permease/ATP-binding subunit 1 n=1 Tax=Bipolaricaulis sibiricus TaxID=2501609 RepID=A0A410FT01_BIPS1|nr:MAG: Heterodimeric efflux ABC transporter, permease/ATP-binding subunit 1 [Candidatus Bipolaricaulis sibiricus]
MRSLVRMFRFVRPYRWYAVGALALLLGMVGADLLIPRLTQRIIDQGIAAGNLGVVATTSLAMIGAALLSTLFAVANTILSVRVGQGFAHDVRSAVMRKVQTFSFANLDRLQTGQLIVRTTSDVSMVEMIVAMSLRILTRAPVWVLGSIVLLVLTSRQLAWMLAAFVPVIVLLVVAFVGRARPMFLAVQQQLDRLNTVLQENLAGGRVVKAFVREEHEAARFDRENVALMRKNIEVMTFFAVIGPTMTLLVNLGVVGAVWLGGRAAIGGAMTVGQVVASVNYLTMALFPMMLIAMMMGPLSAAEASASRIREVLEATPDVEERPGAGAWPATERRGARVAFEDVSFSYNGEPVLRGVSLVAEPGETVAILGATGSGKSTLIHLIPRFYDVTAGRVTVDGVDVRELSLLSLRREIGVALQEAVLFTGTVRDNIRFGRPEATDDEVVAAARAAQAHGFIVELPQGYDTVVGERGVNLSGGQRQRIAIARALLVRPRILILDDSTSAVDIETEIKLQDALDRLMAEDHSATRFVVAQRISTVLLADKIVVLDSGRVAAIGTHSTLLRESPIYRDIYASQLGDGEVADGL